MRFSNLARCALAAMLLCGLSPTAPAHSEQIVVTHYGALLGGAPIAVAIDVAPLETMVDGMRQRGEWSGPVDWDRIIDRSFLPEDLRS